MSPLLKEIRHNPLLWLLVFVPVVLAAQNRTLSGSLNETPQGSDRTARGETPGIGIRYQLQP